ncbi:MAG: CinA family nicotinamide mononucleotide deamidase-related protein [Deltaproteobacteria bacterium]|nr:CinA family nicotinamide mononucleotide deamidase-related protein [Deltaproteobacteria bacterium]
MRAEILTIGDELCRGEIVDTNSSYLAARLWDLGITTRWMTSCNDDASDIAAALRQATARADVVICSGGLGPTEDDLTVDVTAELAGVPVAIDEPARAKMEAFFTARGDARGQALAEIQLRQVRVPAGSRVHGNPLGLAPCFELPIGGIPVICLPGFPREISGIWDHSLGRRLAELREAGGGSPERIARRIYRAFGRGESQLSQACRGLLADDDRGASIHYQVKFPEVLIKLVVRDRAQDAADARLAALDADLRERCGPVLYGDGEETLVERVMRRLLAAQATVATAESCTGGMIGEMLTRMPGSSAAFQGGAIVYSNAEKVRQLGVAEATLAAHGAVSEPAVIEMANGARARFATRLAVSVSGVAGPDGGSPEKPVGTVWLALATPDRTHTRKLSWPGTRDQIRTIAAWWALSMIDAALPSDAARDQARAAWVLP